MDDLQGLLAQLEKIREDLIRGFIDLAERLRAIETQLTAGEAGGRRADTPAEHIPPAESQSARGTTEAQRARR